MSAVLGLIIFALVVLFFCWLIIYFVSKRNPPILKLVWKNKDFQVYELVQDSTFRNMYESLNIDLDKLYITGSVREDFCKNYREKLSHNCGNFFLSAPYLMSSGNDPSVIIVSLRSVGCEYVTNANYYDTGFWRSGIRLIIPRQKS